jgi:hypothetical protein
MIRVTSADAGINSSKWIVIFLIEQ